MKQVNQEPPAKPQLRLVVILSQPAKRMLDAIVQRGEAFNDLSNQDKGLLVGVRERNKLCEARQELERAGYITTERVGNHTHVHLNPGTALPSDLPETKREALIARCVEIDNMDSHGERTDRYSPFQVRRREQIPAWIEVWNFFFPRDAPPSEDTIRYALTLCGDSLVEFYNKMYGIDFTVREIKFRDKKRTHIERPRSYVMKSLERHAKEEGRKVQWRKAWVDYKAGK